MRNLTDNQIRAALRLLARGDSLETVAENCHLRPEIVRKIARGEIRPRQAMIPRRRIPPRRCPRCGGQIFLWPCCVCEPDVKIPGVVEEARDGNSEEGLSGSEAARKAEVDEWREKFGDPSNPEHPLYYRRGEEEPRPAPKKRKRSGPRGNNN